MIQTKPPLIDEFLNSLESSTSTQYRRDLERFIEFANYAAIESIPIGICIQYRASMAELAPNTVNRRLNSVRSYFEFLKRYGSLPSNPMDAVQRVPVHRFEPTNGMTDDEVRRILSSIDLDSEAGRMHYAVLTVMLHLGLRRSEVCKLRIEDISTQDGIETLRIHGKGGKQRILPIPNQVHSAIAMYLLARGSIRGTREPLFSSSRISDFNSEILPLHSQTVAQIFKSACKKAGITKRLSAHSCRVSAISNALTNGASLENVMQMGGWKSLNMVILYDRRMKDIKNSAVWAVDYSRGKK